MNETTAAYIASLVEAAPPLSRAQSDRLGALLQPPVMAAAAA